MASTGTKEYVLKINGVNQSVKDVTTLEAAITALNKTIGETGEATVKVTGTSKGRAAALTEEEKAAKKLADTQKRIDKVNSDANKAQIAANIELREATRLITRQVAESRLAEDSVKAMGMQVTNLRNEYLELSAAQREDAEVGGALLAQLQALDAEYKALKESTGDFRDSVGNYQRAFSGLNEIKDRFELAARGSAEFSASVTGSNDVLDALSTTTDTVAKSSEQLTGIIALATTAQEVYTAVTAEGFIQQKATAIMDGVRAVQLRAKTAAEALSTKGTIAATIAQKAFNLVANANPYVLLALALASVIGALALFASRTSDASEKQKELNTLQSLYLDTLDAEAAKLKELGDDRVKAAERQLALLQAAGAKTGEIRTAEDKLARERAANNARLRGYYASEIANLDTNRKKLEEMTRVLVRLREAQARGDNKITLDVNLDGKVEKVVIEDAIDAVQGQIDNLGRTVKIAVDLTTEQADLESDVAVQNAARLKADADLAKERAEKAKETAKTRADLELAAVRAAEDARIALLASNYERQRATLEAQSRRQIEDLEKTLATEKNLTAQARESIAENIVSITEQTNRDILKLNEEFAAKELETSRALEDQRNAMMLGMADRQRAEVNARYNRLTEDLKKRLDVEKDLSESQRVELNEMVENYDVQRNRELAKIAADGAQQRSAIELAAIDFTLQQANNKIGELTKRNKDGLKLIDVDATRKALAAANSALADYVTRLMNYEADLQAAHKQTLATLKEGTPEYEEELQKYATAHEDIGQRIKAAEKQQRENTKESTKTVGNYYADLFEKIAKYAQIGADLVSNAVDTVNMGLQAQIDVMAEELETLEEHYENAQRMREEAVQNVEGLEQRLQDATGGTAQALKEQLADAMAARNEAARNEQQLQKEKEKREAEIAKKEKQMRRNELIGRIAMSVANTAQGVTAGLSLGFPLGLIVAALIAGLGAVQVGIMAKQLTKLEDGGPIIGPSHANGGVPIGLGYEAEGGEYVVNKKAYAANPQLVEFINASNGTITAADLAGLAPGDTAAPIIINNASGATEDRIVEAIEAINITPVVAVTDIIDAQDQLTTVQDLSGF